MAGRTVLPEQTLLRVAPLMAAAGITRVAVLTGLDILGIPVAAAYRPNSRTVAVHQGKGATLAAAKASAVMEAIETFHAETLDLPLRLGSFADMQRHAPALDPASLPGPGVLDGVRLLWTQGCGLQSGGPVWLPYELVGMDLTDTAAGRNFQSTTNGLASGNTLDEALVHALSEVIERDAIALWEAACGRGAARHAQGINLDSIDDPQSCTWLARAAAAGLTARLWDVTSDIGVPAFACLLSGDDDLQPELGSGCHPARATALQRAIAEAAQARLTVISGAREDIGEEGYGQPGAARKRHAASGWLHVPGQRAYRDAPDVAGGTVEADLRAVSAALQQAGCGGGAWVDLTRPGFGIPVVRVVVPGLEGPWAPPGGPYRPGPRARAAARR